MRYVRKPNYASPPNCFQKQHLNPKAEQIEKVIAERLVMQFSSGALLGSVAPPSHTVRVTHEKLSACI